MAQGTIRTTLALPADVLAQIDAAVRGGMARSRNEFVAAALRRELAAREREAIDAAFHAMADDDEAQQEAVAMTAQFARADWEAFQEAER